MKKMKRIYSITTIIMTALTLTGCAKELEENVQKPDEPKTEDGTMVLGAMLPDSPDADATDAQSADTKTTISYNGDKTYSVHWAEGDAIFMNGKTSTDIQIGENKKSAQFTLPTVNAPYCAIYPADAASGYTVSTPASGNEGEEGYVAAVPAQVTVTVPAIQKYVANGIDPDAAIMYAYSTSATEPLQFKHAMAYLKLTVEGAAVKSVRVNGNYNEMMSGDFILSYNTTENVFGAKPESGTNKPKGNVSVKYLCGDAAIPAGTPMFVAIPATLYENGLTLTVIDDQDRYQVIKSLNPFSASAGKVYPTTVTFNSNEIYNEKGIYTVEDWNAFVADVNSGDWKTNWEETIDGLTGVHLMADIYSSTNLPRTNDKYLTGDKKGTLCKWDGTFYGHNHIITHAGFEPLFIHVGSTGKIQDLIVAGERTRNSLNGWTGSIVLNNAGEIRNCENQMNITLSGANTNAAGICRTNTGTIVGCKNTGKITISNPTAAVNVAGITMTSSGALVNCKNEGDITITGVDQNCIVAGIVQSVSSGAADKVNGLVNNAAITIDAKLTAAKTIYMGGVAANAQYNKVPTHFNNCSNSGALKITKSGTFHMKGGAIGGIVAAITSGSAGKQGVNYTSFDNCSNSGPIAFYESERGGCPGAGNHGAYAIGGILGRCVNVHSDGYYSLGKGYYTVVRNTCYNVGTIDVCTANGQAVAVGTTGARQTYVGAIAGFVDGGSTTSVVRGNSTNQQCTIKVGSVSGGICAGGILGGGYKVNIDGGSNANVNFTVSDNSFITPQKVGYIGAVLGWAASTVSIVKTAASASFDFNDSLKASCFASGFAGVKTGVTLTVAADCTYQENKVTEADIYGGGTATIK